VDTREKNPFHQAIDRPGAGCCTYTFTKKTSSDGFLFSALFFFLCPGISGVFLIHLKRAKGISLKRSGRFRVKERLLLVFGFLSNRPRKKNELAFTDLSQETGAYICESVGFRNRVQLWERFGQGGFSDDLRVCCLHSMTSGILAVRMGIRTTCVFSLVCFWRWYLVCVFSFDSTFRLDKTATPEKHWISFSRMFLFAQLSIRLGC